jgi:hypothetical protein
MDDRGANTSSSTASTTVMDHQHFWLIPSTPHQDADRDKQVPQCPNLFLHQIGNHHVY